MVRGARAALAVAITLPGTHAALKAYANASAELTSLEQFYDAHLQPQLPALLGAHPPVEGDLEAALQGCATPGAASAVCPALLEVLRVPRYAAHDYIARAAGLRNTTGASPLFLSAGTKDAGCVAPAHSLYAVLRGTSAASGAFTAQLDDQGKALLFVPGNQKVTVSITKGAAVRFCLVDASNLHETRRLAKEAPAARFPHDQGITGAELLKALDDPEFDFTMARSYSELSWGEFSVWPRPAPEEKPVHQQTRRRKKNFGSWQSEQRWNWRVVSATIPELPPPEIVHAGRERCELRLASSYERKKHDDQKFGFEVSFEQTRAPDVKLGEVAAWGAGAEQGVQRFDASSLTFDPDVFANHKSYTVDVQDVLPARGYAFKVRLYYGEVEGPWSQPSVEAATPARGAPSKVVGATAHAAGRGLSINIPRPFDDGGAAIKGVVLKFRHHDAENFPGEWRHVGSFAAPSWPLTLDINNELLASREDAGQKHAYEFAVAPYNRLGVAPWSGPTPPAHTEGAEKATSYGHGAFDRNQRHHIPTDDELTSVATARGRALYEAASAHVRTHLDDLFDEHAHSAHGPLVAVGGSLTAPLDVYESLKRFRGPHSRPDYSAPAWLCHHSPRGHRAVAELVAADPLDACTAHRNSAPLRGRVVLVKRGNCPLATKALLAQRAGALGVVIADGGGCAKLDQYCVPGADRSRGEAFARLDLQRPWAGVHVPVVLILADAAAHVLEHFPVTDGLNATVAHTEFVVVADEEEAEAGKGEL